MTQQTPHRVPGSTYRLQFNRQFTLEQATALVDYLDDLGIGACYASPLLQARPGSAHGYDITDHATCNPELGGLSAFEAFAGKLKERGMGLLMDVVPNHMCIADLNNRWWRDVLENGPSSPFAHCFDVDWHPPKPNCRNKILLPILGDQYGRVLENQEIRVRYESGAFYAQYYEMGLPLEPRSGQAILRPVLAAVAAHLGESDEHVLELASTLTALKNLPTRAVTAPAKVKERQREKEIIKRRLAAVVESSAAIQEALADTLQMFNGKKGEPRSFDALEKLLAHQAFRLSFWRVAADEINYRRFFDINDLAAIRVEEPAVFDAVHELILRMAAQGLVSGLRIDHVDGLIDPKQYLERIQRHCRAIYAASEPDWSAHAGYVVVEKILIGDERLKQDWPVAGTTGYDFLNLLNGLFVDGRHRRQVLELYRRFTGNNESFDDLVYESKKVVLTAAMSSELHVLARKLDRISDKHRWSRDFTFNSLKLALIEVIACFPVYRSYIGPSDTSVSDEDRRHIVTALRSAKRRNPSTSATIFDFIASLLLLQSPEGLDEAEVLERRDFVTRFQQLTSPIMAKGLEDTACYRFHPLASLNEVGGDPRSFGVTTEEYHRKCSDRLATMPDSLSATATHDTKRGEDVRARINVLSEIPAEWEAALGRWHSLNQAKRPPLPDREVPSLDEEYLLYQTLLGAWPTTPPDATEQAELLRRVQDYMVKAIKEAKLNTSWINPDEEYEQALRTFIAAILKPENEFLFDFLNFSTKIVRAGMFNSLSQTLLKITAPGVPDFYQGSELWELSLVDPDNRRPVDYAHRRALLETLRRDSRSDAAALCDQLMQDQDLASGRLKMYVTHKALELRRANLALFADGAYEPIPAVGELRHHVVAFARSTPNRRVVVAAARFFCQLGVPERLPLGPEVWRGILALPDEKASGEYRDVFSGRTIRVQEGGTLELAPLFAHLPVALLERIPA